MNLAVSIAVKHQKIVVISDSRAYLINTQNTGYATLLIMKSGQFLLYLDLDDLGTAFPVHDKLSSF